MKTLILTAALLLAACSAQHGGQNELLSGTVERVQQVESLGSAESGPEDYEDELDAARFATQLEVQLDDGRTVILTYSGPRHFDEGQRVRVHVDDKAAFVV